MKRASMISSSWNLEELKFMAFYTKGNEVTAVACMKYNPIVSKMAEVLALAILSRSRRWSLVTGPHREGILRSHAADFHQICLE